jgi:hypothetical protein
VPVALTFRLSLPALVRLTVQAPGAAPVSVPAQAFEAGDRQASVLVPAPPTGVLPTGSWAVTIDADAGGGRIAAAPVGFNMGDPAAVATPTAGAPPEGRPTLLFDLLAMAGPAGSHPAGPPRWAFLLGLNCLLGSAAVVVTNAIRFFQLRLDPGLR